MLGGIENRLWIVTTDGEKTDLNEFPKLGKLAKFLRILNLVVTCSHPMDTRHLPDVLIYQLNGPVAFHHQAIIHSVYVIYSFNTPRRSERVICSQSSE